MCSNRAPKKENDYLSNSRSQVFLNYSDYLISRAYSLSKISGGKMTDEIREEIKRAFRAAKNISRFNWTHNSDLQQIIKVESTLKSIGRISTWDSQKQETCITLRVSILCSKKNQIRKPKMKTKCKVSSFSLIFVNQEKRQKPREKEDNLYFFIL